MADNPNRTIAFAKCSAEVFDVELASQQDGERSNLDDAIDDDNENPVSHTLIGAAENTGPQEISANVELEGEVDEDGEET